VVAATHAVDDLLPLTLSRPREALARARAILADHPGPYEASIAHQATGIVLREFGDVHQGVSELRSALRLARQTGLIDREVETLASLGVALVYAGHTAAGLTAFDRAVRMSHGVLAGHVLHRRALVLWTLGRHVAALEDARRAIAILRRAGDQLWTARALNARGLAHLSLGLPARADADFVAAGLLFAETGQDLESVYEVHNRGLVAFGLGDLPTALSLFDEAAARYRELGVPIADLSIDRCLVLLAAGLVTDALAEADAAVSDLERVHGRGIKKAQLLLIAANCALVRSQPQVAEERAQAAYRLFRAQQSAWWQAHAARVLAQARYTGGPVTPQLLRQADRLAAWLETMGSSEAAHAHLLAGRVARDLGRRSDADRHFVTAAQSRRRGAALPRASGWLAEALRAEAAGNSRRLLTACRRGLEVLDEHRFTLGASELRAQATAHGAELAALAQRYAVRAHRPRLLLVWSERWRSTALSVPPARRPHADAELNVGLAALRDVMRRLEQARHQAKPAPGTRREQQRLEREQRRLEGAVRACALRARGNGGAPGREVVNAADLLDRLGQARLVEIVDIDGTLYVLVCGAGQVRQFTAGRTEEAARAAGMALFALRRLARNRPGNGVAGAQAILDTVGPKLQDALLGPGVRWLGEGPVVIVPPARLHSIPWALLPALRDRPVGVAPSAGAWMRGHDLTPPSRQRVMLARGPGLASNGAEVPVLARLYDDVTMLAGQDATTQNVLQGLDGAWLAHIAAHGSFRADSPLFSSLRVQDGPLTVYDFEQLQHAPYRLVLPSCDSGVLAPTGADELLGVVSSLLPLGTAGIVAAVSPLNDQAVVPVMLALHRHLRAGQTLAEAVLSVRRGLNGDPVRQATAVSLVALGAA
jgi:tetratricopeptide (TPR) repeat protein